MDSIKQKIRQLFDKDTRRGRAMRTILQALIALTSAAGALLAMPAFAEFVTQNEYLTISALATWIGVVTYLQNWLEDFREGIE